MFSIIRTAALSAAIGLGALAALPATAQADSFYFGISPGGPTAGIIVDEGRSYHRPPSRWDRDRWDRWDRHDRRDRWDRDRWDRGCSAGQALRKADRMGLYRTRISAESRHTITVSGRRFGRHISVSFAKARSCPVIR